LPGPSKVKSKQQLGRTMVPRRPAVPSSRLEACLKVVNSARRREKLWVWRRASWKARRMVASEVLND